MNIARIFVHAFARRVAVVVVAALFGLVATCTHNAQASDHATLAEAVAHMKTETAWNVDQYCATAFASIWGSKLSGPTIVEPTPSATLAYVRFSYQCYRNMPPAGPINPLNMGATHSYPLAQKCVLPEKIDVETGTCKDPAARCLAKNDDSVKNSTQIYTGQKCMDGCVYGARPGKTGAATIGGSVIMYGEIGYTGETCAVEDPAPPKKPEECVTPPGQLTVCVKDDGKHCYTASTGRRICWTPGETGTKTDGDVAQVRAPGSEPPTPPTPPPGETFNDSGKPTPTSTTTPGGTTSNTTTNNFTTGNGTDAGEENDGEAPGEEGEGEPGEASGGDGCDQPPVCSGDSIGCASLMMIWRVRCSEGRNKVTEGGGECDANGNPLLVCTGDQVACKAMLLEAELVCAANKTDANNDGQPDWTKPGEGDGTEGAGEEPGENVGKVQTASFGAPVLDETGLSWSRACPDLGTLNLGYFGSFDLNSVPWICDFTALVRGAFFLLGSFLALCIVMGWRGF